MSDDCLTLTTYSGERDRTAHHLLADELIALYERHQVKVSVLLRGIEGFGRKHGAHTDRSLTLSEDLPVVSVAVDTRARIDALLPELLKIKRRGLLTLERARLLSEIAPEPEFETIALLGPAAKLTVYVGRRERAGGRPAFVAVTDMLHRRGLAGATVLLAVDGTVHGARARARFFAANAEVPMMVVSIGPSEQIASVLPELGALLTQPLLTLERVDICKRDGALLGAPAALGGVDEHGLERWQKLTIHSSERTRSHGHPMHRVLVRRLRASRVAGATTVRGIWGFHGDHTPHGDKLLQRHRHVPVVTTVIDTSARIAEAFAIVDELTGERGLVTAETVPAAYG